MFIYPYLETVLPSQHFFSPSCEYINHCISSLSPHFTPSLLFLSKSRNIFILTECIQAPICLCLSTFWDSPPLPVLFLLRIHKSLHLFVSRHFTPYISYSQARADIVFGRQDICASFISNYLTFPIHDNQFNEGCSRHQKLSAVSINCQFSKVQQIKSFEWCSSNQGWEKVGLVKIISMEGKLIYDGFRLPTNIWLHSAQGTV